MCSPQRMRIISCIIVWMLVASTQLLSQPLAPTKWYQLRTQHGDIIFRGNIYREAQQLANRLTHIHEPIIQSLGTHPYRVPIILRNQKARPSGFVTLMPHKVELGTFPTQDYNFVGAVDWLSILTVHEFRHVVQYAHLKQNFNQLLYWLGGDACWGGMIAINLPLWFLEGDTTSMETILTQGGRGRIPYFSLRYRTNLLTHRNFSYTKQVLGSFKDPVPNHYRLGYYLVTYLRRHYGPKVVADILQKTTLLRPLTTAIKQTTGKSLRQIYEASNQELKAHWQQQLKDLKLTQAIRLNTRSRKDYIDYTCPQLDKNGHLVVLKSGMGTVTQFISLDDKQRTKHLFTPGNIVQNIGFSTAKDKIVWVEIIPDPRWSKDRSYGVIQRYNTKTKRLRTLTHKSRYGAAALSPDATQIVAFESDEAYNHRLVILDAETGQVVKRLPNPENHFYQTPRWSVDGKHIVAIKSVQQGATIALINSITGETQDLLPYSTEHIGRPTMVDNYVLYNSAYSGIDNIYAIDLSTHQRYQVTSRAYGAYHPIISADGRWLIFNDFTENGMDVVKMPFLPQQWTPIKEVKDRSVHYHAPLIAQEGSGDVLAKLPNDTYPVKRYTPWKHGLNVHSWFVLQAVQLNTRDPKKPSELLQKLQLDIFKSTDLLDTREWSCNYIHDFKTNQGIASTKICYKGWYPVISLEGTLVKDYKRKYDDYNKALLSLDLGLPLQFVRGQYTHNLSLNTTSGVVKAKDMRAFYKQVYQGSFNSYSKRSLRDIYYPWKQKLAIRYGHTPLKGDYQQQSVHAETELAFPGLGKHHSLRLEASYRYEHEHEIIRNYARIDKKVERSTIVCSYGFPICYPDWSVGYFLYIKRLKANISYIFINNIHAAKGIKRYENSVCLDILTDIHPCVLLNNVALSMGLGARYSLDQHRCWIGLTVNLMPN
ncbi:MAG: hypothetical protein ACX93T_02410 [Bacteroidota bacterium]